MARRLRHLAVIFMTAAWLTACGSAVTKGDNWSYIGPEAALKLPPMMLRPGNASDPAWKKEADEKMAAWQSAIRQAADTAKAACASETGESVTPGYLTGYGDAFMACMKRRGWARFSDPL